MKKSEVIQSLRDQICGQRAYERTLQQLLEIANKDAREARDWAQKAEVENMGLRVQISRLIAQHDGSIAEGPAEAGPSHPSTEAGGGTPTVGTDGTSRGEEPIVHSDGPIAGGE